MIHHNSQIRVDYPQSVRDFLAQCDVYISRREISKALSILSRLSLFQYQHKHIQDAIATSLRAQGLALSNNFIKETSFLCLQEADFHIGLYAYPFSIGKYIDAIFLSKKMADSDSEFRILQRFSDLYNTHSALHGVLCSSFKNIEVSSYVSPFNFFEILTRLVINSAKKVLDKGLNTQSTELYNLLPQIIRHFESSFQRDTSIIQNNNKNSSSYSVETDYREKLADVQKEYEVVRESLERKNAFVRSSIHDLTNPLQNIRMFSELLQQMLPEIGIINDAVKTDLEELTDTLKKSTVDVLHILSQMSLYSSVERNIFDTNVVEISFPLLIQNEVNKLKEQFQLKRISIRFMQEVPDITFKTKVKSLGFIFAEMLQNALKFSPIQSIVAVNIQTKQLQNQQILIRISVRDQGLGIKQEESHKIGRPFTKLSAKPTNNETSAGMGLAIATILSNQLQGKLHFDHRQPVGCTIHFDFTISNV